MDFKSLFSPQDEVWFAIDFGTSNSLVAATNGKIASPPLPLDGAAVDPTIFRSLLYFPHQDKCFYASEAIERYCDNTGEGRLIRSIKKYLPISSFSGSWIDDRLVRLEDLIGLMLLEMRKRAGRLLDREVTSVMLGRPARFSPDPSLDRLAEYRMTKAAEFAGFKRIEFLPEPLAAAFDLRRRLIESKKVLIVDLGGGTSDFTVLEIGPKPFREKDVLALSGVSIAGDVMDGRVMEFEIAPHLGSKVHYRVPLAKNILQMPKSLLDYICSPADISQIKRGDFYPFFQQVRQWALSEDDKRRLNRLSMIIEDQLGFKLFEAIESCKRELSRSQHAGFHVDLADEVLDLSIQRDGFATDVRPAVEKILDCMNETVKAAGLKNSDIDLVYPTGGTSKMLQIQEALTEAFSPDRIVQGRIFHSVIEGLVERTRELIA